VPIDAIVPNGAQPRNGFDEDALVVLAESIRERGILQPPVVRELDAGHFELIAGERRWRAARLAGLVLLDVLVRVTDDAESLQDALMENIIRQDCPPSRRRGHMRR
jgi:ParB family transcriptional regulator, chromosome partitioning protein